MQHGSAQARAPSTFCLKPVVTVCGMGAALLWCGNGQRGRAMLRTVEHGGIRLAAQSFGDPGDPALLLIMGATASMLGWPDEFCAALAQAGLFVIRFDHRDTGQSTTVPPGEATYAVEDMAADVVAVAAAFGRSRVHLAGMSLGGYIAQMVAVAHPEQVASLTLIGAEPLGWDGEPLPQISVDFMEHFAALGGLDWSDEQAVTAFLVESERLCAGTSFDADRERARVGRVLARTESPASMFNHGALTLRQDWTGRFREIACPVLVIHGDADPILPVENGRALAAGVAGASLVILPEVGHELPPARSSEIAGQIAAHVARSSNMHRRAAEPKR
jgi:pimeloyl-ACP methyl ester carboxylesterase